MINSLSYVLLTVVFAGILQSGFSLGTSMLTQLSGHHFGHGRSQARLMRLGTGFVLGSVAMIFLILAALCYACLLLGLHMSNLIMLLSGASTVLSGVWFLFFYYRSGAHGTALWIPRSFARYLSERTKRTRSTSESFVLGTASVLYELPFTIGLLTTAALQICLLPASLEIPAVLIYAGLATLTLFGLFIAIASGHTGSELTRWRSSHKRFLQVIVGIGLIALGACVSLSSVYAALANRGISLW